MEFRYLPLTANAAEELPEGTWACRGLTDLGEQIWQRLDCEPETLLPFWTRQSVQEPETQTDGPEREPSPLDLDDEPTVDLSGPNWDHWRGLGGLPLVRDRHLEVALRKIRAARGGRDLYRLTGTVLKYYGDGKKCQGVGFDYKRFATAMNAIADRAAELGLKPRKRYEIKTLPKQEDGSLGQRVGFFLAEKEQAPASDVEAFEEARWISRRFRKSNPTGFVPRTWKEIQAAGEAVVKNRI
jgi:hypothetical protein